MQLANGVNDPLLPCPAWTVAGTVPAIIWLYWTGDTTWGTVLLFGAVWLARSITSSAQC